MNSDQQRLSARTLKGDGTAQGPCEGAPCIKIYVARKTPGLLARIPTTIGGHPAVVEETGEFKALER